MTGTEQLTKPKVIILFTFMLVAGLMRALPFPPNFAPIGAMALFGGAYFADRRMAYLLPLAAMLFSDLVLEVLHQIHLRPYSGFHEQMIGVYVSFIGIVFIGTLLQKRIGFVNVAAGSLAASLLFFIVSNFSVWLFSSIDYTRNATGLVSCYTMAIPFFGNTIKGDLFYTGLMFGAYEALKFRFPKLAFVK